MSVMYMETRGTWGLRTLLAPRVGVKFPQGWRDRVMVGNTTSQGRETQCFC